MLDLDAALGSETTLLIGGGYGLFLKQLYLADHPGVRTLLTPDDLPDARTTNDIDLILRAEIVTDSESMKSIRMALDELDCRVVETAKYTQFSRSMPQGQVKIDLLAAPLGHFAERVPKDPRRVKPRPSVKLHASKLEEALAVDRHALSIPVEGKLSAGEEHRAEVLVPQAFSYLLMKLCAFRDRMNDVNRSLGQHHALDIYRIVGMLTREEDTHVRSLSAEYAEHPTVTEARAIAAKHFISPDGLGRLRIREHPLYKESMELDRFGSELSLLLGISG
ncbi:hypothetical protein [Roseimaritima sediminicola]|uniref:hypothetical protein n=1 Tax=Roseimaritima sediminicola TaxID=2662066 RepID=UPI0012983B4A|nr:hypothetical protein [Roseimaritima sediminicola]